MHILSLTVLFIVLLVSIGYLVFIGKKEKYWGRPGWRRGGWGGRPFRGYRRGFYGGGYYSGYPAYEIENDNGDCNCANNTPTENNCVNGTVPYCNDDKCRCDY